MRKVIIFLSFLICIFTLFSGCADASTKFESYIKQGDYRDALELYDSKILGNSAKEQEADGFLAEYLNRQWDNYLNGDLQNDDFNVTLDTYQKISEAIDVSDLDQILQEYQIIEQARAAFEDGAADVKNGNYVEAIQLFEQVPETQDDTYQNAQKQLQQAKSLYSAEILETAQENLDGGNYDAAISLVEEAEKIIGSSDELEDFLCNTYTEKFEVAIEETLAASEYEELIRLYEQATSNSRVTVSSTMTANYSTGTDKYADEVLKQASAAKDTEGLPAAIKAVQEGLSIVSNQSKLITQLDALSTEYVQEILKEAENTFQGEGYDAAIKVINRGLSILPDNENFLTALNEYESYVPIDITDVLCVSDECYLFDIEGSLKDNYNNEYSSGYYLYAGESDLITARFRLEGKYSKLNGKVAYFYPQDTWIWGTIRFYDDNGNLLFETNKMDVDSSPQEFSFSVEGVQNLTIKTNGSSWACELILPYLQVQK